MLAALGGRLAGELVLVLRLLGFADLVRLKGDDELAGFAMTNQVSGHLGEGVADLAGEGAAVELIDKFLRYRPL